VVVQARKDRQPEKSECGLAGPSLRSQTSGVEEVELQRFYYYGSLDRMAIVRRFAHSCRMSDVRYREGVGPRFEIASQGPPTTPRSSYSNQKLDRNLGALPDLGPTGATLHEVDSFLCRKYRAPRQ
jgi:hypothetical protein